MKKLFPTISETTAHLLKCCILLGIALLLVLAPIPFVKNDLPDAPATYVVEKDYTIYSEFDTDTVTTRVRAGETLKVYGFTVPLPQRACTPPFGWKPLRGCVASCV